ncbi:hypothetical protein [Curtobacterium sp. DN_7.5]|uniref:arsenate reductase/protein-tyrosine-phosphatase family protein n=1 Tax=Curtobacterium sp. DN_7.5 TaxID=3049047 RepID=UPI001F5902E2|nr:hypothetical protein [Curtobacterium sp. DN_7.5]
MSVIVIACEGNICRSPYVQFALADALDRSGVHDHSVRSVGVRTVAGRPMFHRSSAALAAAGITGHESFRSSPATPALLADADLVLTMERWHRSSIVERVPRTLRRVFTLREAARIASRADLVADVAVTGGDVAAVLRRRRLDAITPDPVADDIPDPVAGDAEAHAAFRRTADDAVSALVPLIVACASGAAA